MSHLPHKMEVLPHSFNEFSELMGNLCFYIRGSPLRKPWMRPRAPGPRIWLEQAAQMVLFCDTDGFREPDTDKDKDYLHIISDARK